jgi:hypothetical protein
MSNSGDSIRWLYSRDGRVYGPLSLSSMQEICRNGQLKRNDLICREGAEEWVPASSLPLLIPSDLSSGRMIDNVPIQPHKTESFAESTRLDRWWRNLGVVYCTICFGLCAVAGFFKGPPQDVRLQQEMLQNVEQMTIKAQSEVRKAQDDLSRQKEEFEGYSSRIVDEVQGQSQESKGTLGTPK